MKIIDEYDEIAKTHGLGDLRLVVLNLLCLVQQHARKDSRNAQLLCIGAKGPIGCEEDISRALRHPDLVYLSMPY